ncbi:MAG: DUF5777 family beta-barrel protein [Bacteroidota bacterium]
MKHLLFLLLLLSFAVPSQAQIRVYQTFKDTRIINSHSVETTPRRKLDIRIGHRFGDFAGSNGGWQNFYGLENAEDIMIGANYGVSDKLTIGVFRTKGSSQLQQNLHGEMKFRIFHQTDDGSTPLSLTFTGLSSLSTMEKSESPESVANFDKFTHRLSYHAQLLLARKFSDRFALQVSGGYVHRNQVTFDDDNGLLHIGAATRIQITKVLGIIADIAYPISSLRDSANDFYPPIGIGLEIETGGHVFQVNFTNATGIMETDYLPYTNTNWGDGEFRLGFTISRLFNL